MGKRRIVTFELRAGKDDDLNKALEGLPIEEDRSDVLRRALRAFFGLGGVSTRVSSKNSVTEAGGTFPDDLRGVSLQPIDSKNVDDGLDTLLGSF